MIRTMSRLVESFRALDGVRVRVVATLETLDYELEYVRPDLEYTAATLDGAYRDLMANRLSADAFGKEVGLGGLDAQTFLFEESVVFLFPSSRYEAVFVSFDRTRPFPFFEVVDVATDVLAPPDDAQEGEE